MTSSVSAVDNQLYSLDSNDIETTTIIDAYNMLGFGLQKTMLLEIIAKVPEVKSLLFIALQGAMLFNPLTVTFTPCIAALLPYANNLTIKKRKRLIGLLAWSTSHQPNLLNNHPLC